MKKRSFGFSVKFGSRSADHSRMIENFRLSFTGQAFSKDTKVNTQQTVDQSSTHGFRWRFAICKRFRKQLKLSCCMAIYTMRTSYILMIEDGWRLIRKEWLV